VPARTKTRSRSIARQPAQLAFRLVFQEEGRILELLVFDELPDQIPPRIVFFRIFVRRLLIDREQTSTFQVDEIGRHNDEFAGNLNVQFFERIDVFEVLTGQSLERDFINIDLVALDEIEQQIKRPFENLESNFVVGFHLLARL